MHTTITNPTRRAMLGAFGIGTTAIAIGATAATRTPTSVTPHLTALLDQERLADAACTEYWHSVQEPARQRWQAALDEIPHYEFVGGLNIMDRPITYTTRRANMVAMCKGLVEREGRLNIREEVRDARRLTAAAKLREREGARLRKAYDIDVSYAECDRLTTVALNAMDAIVSFTAANIADVQAKMLRIMQLDYFECTGTDEAIAADIARLAAREA